MLMMMLMMSTHQSASMVIMSSERSWMIPWTLLQCTEEEVQYRYNTFQYYGGGRFFITFVQTSFCVHLYILVHGGSHLILSVLYANLNYLAQNLTKIAPKGMCINI